MGENNEDGLEIKVVEMEEKDKDDACEVELISEENEEVKWEEFIPRMVIRVLLVEADDSTRQILTALLRKCNYKVAAVADGLKAWEILKKRHSCIDLVLTELDLPSISGYALLSLIMEHDGCKNIPVIVMSSQDSVSMVLKCILKGAADFLIKPVRKNELKNLWRHVWKRLSINDGRNPQNLATEQHSVEATFENNIATNHSEDNVSTSQKSSKCSDKATDGQDFSWMKCSDEETGLSTKEKEHYLKNVKIEKELALLSTEGKEGRLESSGQSNNEGDVSITLREDENRSSTGLATAEDSVGPTNYRRKANGDDQRSSDPCQGVIDLIGGMKRQKCVPSHASFNGDFSNLNSTPELNLSLRRVHDSETIEADERRILNHSNASAFSWYNSNKKSQTSPPLSISEVTEVKVVSDPSPCPKTINISQDEKPIVGPQGVCSGCAPMCQPMSSDLAGPNPDILAKSSKSTLHKEEIPLLTSPSLHSDQAEHEIGNASSQIVGPSCSSTSCNEFADQKKISACASSSDLTDNNANGPVMTGTSIAKEAVKVEGCNTFELDQFKHRTSHHSAERAAALAKFRLKRKGRCFEKKVRYQSRKTLAEQRLRVKGQFVRHVPTDQILTHDGKT